MKIEVRESPYKMVLFWVSQEEASDKALMAFLKPQFAKWKALKYQPVVLESGKGNLEESMYMLMKRNLELLAKSDTVAMQ